MNTIKEGVRVKVITNTSDHNYVIGRSYIVGRYHNGMWRLCELKNPGVPCGNNCYPVDLKIVMLSADGLIKISKELEGKILVIESKITFMTKHNKKELDEKEFKSYGILEFMSNGEKTDKDKLDFLISMI